MGHKGEVDAIRASYVKRGSSVCGHVTHDRFDVGSLVKQVLVDFTLKLIISTIDARAYDLQMI